MNYTAQQVKAYVINIVANSANRTKVGSFTLSIFVEGVEVRGMKIDVAAGNVIQMAKTIEDHATKPVTFGVTYNA